MVNVEIKQTETHYVLTLEDSKDTYSVRLTVDHKNREIDIVNSIGKGFCFLGSDPEVAVTVSRLIYEAADYGKRILDGAK